MAIKIVGQVSPEEKETVKMLFERKNGLSELSKIVTADNEELYEKVVKDMGQTSFDFQKWWDDMSVKYSWESAPNGHWEIDFDKNQIYLITED